MSEELLAAVASEYATTPEASISWPDPHPDRQPAPDEEYSRVTDPQRYQIVGARADAWERALIGLGLAAVEPADVPVDWNVPHEAAATRLTPVADAALPLIVVRGSFENTPHTVIALGIGGEESIFLDILPDCGCDACDYGSDDLLEAIDDAYLGVVASNFVEVKGRGWSAHTTYGGWSGTGEVPSDLDMLIAAAHDGRQIGERALVGSPWLRAPSRLSS